MARRIIGRRPIIGRLGPANCGLRARAGAFARRETPRRTCGRTWGRTWGRLTTGGLRTGGVRFTAGFGAAGGAWRSRAMIRGAALANSPLSILPSLLTSRAMNNRATAGAGLPTAGAGLLAGQPRLGACAHAMEARTSTPINAIHPVVFRMSFSFE
jgi:hypothetical protein